MPVEKFTSHTPGDGTVFDQLERQFGSCLEELGQEEKYCLMAAILNWLAATDEKQLAAAIEEFSLSDAAEQQEAALRDELWGMLPAIEELSVSDLLGLCEAMLSQAKEAVRQRFAELRGLQESFQSALESQGVPSDVAGQAAGILAYEQKNPGYERTAEEQRLIKAIHYYVGEA